MEILGVGPLELFFILIIALIFLGPRDMVKTGRSMGKYLRKIVMSPTWRMVQQTSRELRTLPNRMIREAGMEEDIKDLDQIRKDMENQIGSIRKPFSAAAGEVNENLQAAQSTLTVQSEPAAPGQSETAAPASLSAWTTPPKAAKPAENSTLTSETKPASASDQPAAGPAEDPNSDPS